MNNALTIIFYGAYFLAHIATFGKLTFFDCYIYTWWNWVVAVPMNFIMATLWPVYWLLVRPIMGGGC